MKKLFYNGPIITMEQMNAEEEKAIGLIIDDERIDEVIFETQRLQQVLASDVEIIDLKGHTLMPSFIDGHSHFVGFANALRQVDVSKATCFADIVSILNEFKETHHLKDGEWIIARGYDHNFLKEKRHPNRYILDKVSTKHPIILSHASSHMGVLNTAALEKSGLPMISSDIIGGRYGRDLSGILNGYMEENAFMQMQNMLPLPSEEELMQLLEEAQKIYASYGITTIQDGMMSQDVMHILSKASEHQKLWLDIIGYADLNKAHEATQAYKQYRHTYTNHFKLGGYKIFLDGSPQGRTAWMSTPYLHERNYYGYPIHKNIRLFELIETSVMENMQLLAHCNGDAAAQQYITQFEEVKKLHPNHDLHRPVMIHAQLVREDQLKRMLPLHMIPSFFIAHTYFWGDVHIENFGKERADRISPAKSAQELGLPYTFHQDSPVVRPDMMMSIWCAVNRVSRSGKTIGEEQRISVYDACRAVTANGAYQYNEEDQKGTLKKGKLADMIILEENPLTADKERLKDIRVLATFKEGTCVFKHKDE